MTRIDQEYALVLEAGNKLVADMARNVLQDAGIPSLLHGPDFDVAELGAVVHSQLRGVGVYVPRAAEAAAKALLDEAFGGEVPEDASDDVAGEGPDGARG